MKRYLERIQDVVDKIEENILDDVDYMVLSKIACCPMHHFQRIFTFITEMTPSEYVRRRRLTLAANELRETNGKVIDVALKYGYDSHAAFARAFKEHHGISPSSTRNENAKLNNFDKLSFNVPLYISSDKTYRIEKGQVKMASLKCVEFVEIGPYKIIGKEIRTKALSQGIPILWDNCFNDETFDTLFGMSDYVPDDISNDMIGHMRDYHEENGTFTYMVGMFMKKDTPVPAGFVSYDLPKCNIAKAWIEGEEYDIYKNAHLITLDAIKDNGYEVDESNYYFCEVYTNERFTMPKNNGEDVLIVDYYIPCVKK